MEIAELLQSLSDNQIQWVGDPAAQFPGGNHKRARASIPETLPRAAVPPAPTFPCAVNQRNTP